MLVLARKNGESILISSGIEVKVLAIRGGTVKLGFSAPSDVRIRRREIAPLPADASEGTAKRAARCAKESESGAPRAMPAPLHRSSRFDSAELYSASTP
jgi:carbon storage regulator